MTITQSASGRHLGQAPFVPAPISENAGARQAIDRTGRVLFSLVLLALAAGMIIFQQGMRHIEAALTATWLNPFISGGVSSARDIFFVHMSPTSVIAFRITAECTSVILIAPLLAVAAISMLSQKISWVRGVVAILAMVTVITVVNQMRLGLIAWMSQVLGMDLGYDLSHRILGSILGIVGFATGASVMVIIMGIRRRKRAER